MKKSLLINRVKDTQLSNGSWGCFHSLAKGSSSKFTTEQAIRILYENNFTLEDEIIQKAMQYLEDCLDTNIQPPDRREKVLNWDFFEKMMLATWIKMFAPNHKKADIIAEFWCDIIKKSIVDQRINETRYEYEYRKRIPKLNKTERFIGISQFYMVSLLVDKLDYNTQKIFIEYIINNHSGIYYIYDNKIVDIPTLSDSKGINKYLSAIRLLLKYPCAHERLIFINDWCRENFSTLVNNKNVDKENLNYILDTFKETHECS